LVFREKQDVVFTIPLSRSPARHFASAAMHHDIPFLAALTGLTHEPRTKLNNGLYGYQIAVTILKLACYTATGGLDCAQKKS
jgi:hypothetical protein